MESSGSTWRGNDKGRFSRAFTRETEEGRNDVTDHMSHVTGARFCGLLRGLGIQHTVVLTAKIYCSEMTQGKISKGRKYLG